MFDLYQSNKNNTARFLLGKHGTKNLLVVGLNPSTAVQDKSDNTATKVEQVAIRNGFDGFVMSNLYPRRATLPENLPTRKNVALFEENIASIRKILSQEKKPVVWAAWGGDIRRRGYLTQAFLSIDTLLRESGGKWLHFGALRKDGHPRHPSRLSYAWSFSAFDANAYTQQLSARN